MESAVLPAPPVEGTPEVPETEPLPVDAEVIVQGDGQLSWDVGGRAPTKSSIRLVGGKLELEGEFAKGQIVAAYVEFEVGSVEFRDERDPKTGDVLGCERAHKARIVGFRRE